MSNYGWLKTLLMFVIAFAVQSTIGDWLKILGVGPDFILIFIVSVALRFGAGTGCFWGFLAGFTLDVYAPVEWLGANTIAMTIVGFAVGQLEEHILTLYLPAKVAVLGIAFLVNDLFYFLITGLDKNVVTTLFLTKTLPECVYTLIIGGILFYLSSEKKSNV
ncbi:putative membrane protein [Fibrobacter succinogenes subsp. succinogenes S85]|uniref:Putative membrane protein n=1 Tax=Fibrobacter succinogenes (strain ATCC 19169 / S85) TaxID=59374 RepID=C9RIM1_FIBSS|nr:rod shape-determining protein MreD [Fibrobacter succinogenes]ACX75492.1 rod shape-determining protein MreD [Fibrobacter succinogenes subsp. succinogenes S85]ADL26121.1 putative membrane protein [Fibrobacter succinogenes subsp. succinogenes S85]